MPCYYPLRAWRSKRPNENGNFPLVFDRRYGNEDEQLDVPCGNCIGCRLERSRQWAIRCVHESQCHIDNTFVTLTYDEEHLPDQATLVKADFQKFIKRLRKHISPEKIKYFACGEYGSDLSQPTGLGRPHFHAIIFGYDFKDKYYWRQSGENECYRSDTLETLWTYGQSEIGSVTFNSAAYVARYCTKKINGDDAENHYQKYDPYTGELYPVEPEFNLQSQGIGKTWYENYQEDTFKDYIHINGVKCQPPKYYDRLADQHDDTSAILADNRIKRANHAAEKSTYDVQRLKAGESIQLKKQSIFTPREAQQ